METKKSPKIPKKYICESCDYLTSNKKDFNKHLLTAKHQKMSNGTNLEIMEIGKSQSFICICDKEFLTKSGLWKHKQTCNYNSLISNTKTDTENMKILTNLVFEVVKQNQELMVQNNETQKQNQELTNKLFEICKN